jgi:hypothetical protein
MSDVRIQEVATDVIITEPVGPLSAEDVKRIVTQVLHLVREEQERAARSEKDTRVHGSSADAYGN